VDPFLAIKESRLLDIAYLKRDVPAAIDRLAREAMEEVDRGSSAADDSASAVDGGNASPAGNAPVVSG
jgi:hypothetical protein